MKIELKDLSLNFQEKEILNKFNLVVEDKDKIIISGNSGKGKSTLLKILMGFQPFESGQYIINGKNFYDYEIHDVRRNFAYIDQDVSLRKIKVQEYLNIISKYHNNNLSHSIDLELCDYFDFDIKLLDKNITQLSGGERQRLAIIIAIMMDRPCFLFDEITSALDKTLKSKVVSYFENTEKMVISISHDSVWLKNDKFKRISL
ncbi:MAG: ABC transporter ATP-binding protein [Pleomorphochaeta sp.]